jgi:hypothetical protein
MVTATDLGPFTMTVQGPDGPDTILISLTIHLRAQTAAEKVHPSLAFETGPLHGQGLEVFHYRRVSLVDHLPIDEGVVHVVVRLVVGLALQVAAALIVVEFALQMVVIGLSVEDVVHEAVAPTAVHPVADVILGAAHPVAGVLYPAPALYVMVILLQRVPTGLLGRDRGRDPPPVFQSLPRLHLQEPLTETVHPPF